MWLINCSTFALELHDVDGPNQKPYWILSHTWGLEEVTYPEMRAKDLLDLTKKGFEKIRSICPLALEAGCQYAWVDTCCIDKSCSAELSESMNSMFYWYQRAKVCFAYLEDIEPREGLPSLVQLRRCRWFTHGWTLQELIVPKEVWFFDGKWNFRGTKKLWQKH